jgi:hypothetical protein
VALGTVTHLNVASERVFAMPHNHVLFTAHSALRFPERVDIGSGLSMKLDREMRGRIRWRFDEAIRRGIVPVLRGVGEAARLAYELPLTSDPLGVRAALVLEADGWHVTTILPKVDVVVVEEEREMSEIPWPTLKDFEEKRGAIPD